MDDLSAFGLVEADPAEAAPADLSAMGFEAVDDASSGLVDLGGFGLEEAAPLEEFGIEEAGKGLASNAFSAFLKGVATESAGMGQFLIRVNRDLRRNGFTNKMDWILPSGMRNFRDNMEDAALGVLTDYKEKAVPLAYDPDEEFEQSFGGKLATGAGGMVPMLVGAAATGGASVGPVVARGVVMGLGGLQAGEHAYEEAVQAGASEREAMTTGYLNAAFTAASEGVLGAAGRVAGRLVKGSPARAGLRAAVGDFAGESVQEASEQGFGNFVAADVVGYDPDRPLLEGTGEAAILGGILGLGANVATLPLQAAAYADFRKARDVQVAEWIEAGATPEQVEAFADARDRDEWAAAERSVGAEFTLRSLGVAEEIRKGFADRIREAKTPEQMEEVRGDIEQYLFEFHGLVGTPFGKPVTEDIPRAGKAGQKGVQGLEGKAEAEAALTSKGDLRLGGETVVVGTKDLRLPGRYAVVKREDLVASHNPDFTRDERYPLENTRDYSQVNEQAKVMDVIRNFDPVQHVVDSPSASVGPAVVARVLDGQGPGRLVVLGGNNRQMAISGMSPDQRVALAEYTNARVDRFGVDPLVNPDEELVRFVGEFDLRKPGVRERLQGVIDGLNPSPGKVQNLGELARVDAENSVRPDRLRGLKMGVSPAEAQGFVNEALGAGLIDRNLRGQAAESGAAAQGYVRNLLGHSAYRMPGLVEFMNRQDQGTVVSRGLFEAAVPALVEMRAKGMNDLADAVSRSMGNVYEALSAKQGLPESLDFAARQLELDPELSVANDLAQELRESVVVDEKGRVRTADSLEALEGLWARIQAGMEAFDDTPDMFGAAATGPQQLSGILAAIRRDRALLKDAMDQGADANFDVMGMNDDGKAVVEDAGPEADFDGEPGAVESGSGIMRGGNGLWEADGLPDRAAPLALRMVPRFKKGAQDLRDWQKVTLGNLDKVKPMAMPELLRLVRELGGEVRTKNLPKAYGYHQAGRVVLDKRIFRDPVFATQVFAHEIGHLADWFPDGNMGRGNLIGRLRSLNRFLKEQYSPGTPKNKEIREELWKLSAWWRPLDEQAATPSHLKYRKSAKELYADALSVLFNAPEELKERAPTFFNEFFRHLDAKPRVKKELLDTWALLNRPMADLASARSHDVKEMFGKGAELMAAKAQERDWELETPQGWLHRLKKYAYSKYYPAEKLAKAREGNGITIRRDEQLERFFDEFPLGDNVSYRMLESIMNQVEKPLLADGFSKIQLSEYLFFNRVVNERLVDADGNPGGRSNLANPMGHTRETARMQLSAIRRQLGLERFEALEGYARRFQDLIYDIMRYAANSGIISQEQLAELKRNRYNYVTFQTLDQLEVSPHVPAGIQKQLGTLKEIGDVLDFTVLKAISTIRYAQYNHGKKLLVERLKEFGEIETAVTKWNGTRMEPVQAPVGKENMTVKVDGRSVHYVVEPELMRMFEKIPPARMNPILQLVNFGFRHVYYPMWVKYSPGFQLYRNLIRDFGRSVKNLPPEAGNAYTAGARLAWSNLTTLRTAWRRMKGVNDPLVLEMMGVTAIGTPYDTFTRNAFRDDVLGQIMQKYHLLPENEKSKFLNSRVIKPIVKVLDAFSFMGAVFETTPKIGAYKLMVKRLGMDKKEAAFFVRNRVGTPPFHRQGTGSGSLGAIYPFANVFIQGFTEDIRAMSEPRTRGAWWLRWASTGGILTLMKVAAEEGYLDEIFPELSDWFAGISDYKKTNYNLVPLGFLEGDEYGKKSWGIQLPMDESERVLNGMMYKALKAAHGDGGNILNILSVGAGTFPGLNPNIDISKAWFSYGIGGNNPMDMHTMSPILSRDQYQAGGMHGAVGMLAWTAKKSGIMNFFRYNPEANTTTEHVLTSVPVVNSAFLVSNYGHREKINAIDEIIDSNMSKVRLAMNKEAYAALRKYNGLRSTRVSNRTPEQQEMLTEMSAWHRQMAPIWEDIQDLVDLGELEQAKKLAAMIPPP